jgi:hypothetical protein
MCNKETRAKNSIAEGLDDAIAYAKGDKSRAKEYKSGARHMNRKNRKKTIINGDVYEGKVYRGPVGGSGYVYPNQELVKKYWWIALLLLLMLI